MGELHGGDRRVQRAIADFEAYILELAEPVARDRSKAISGDTIACYDLISYSAEVADLNSPPMRRLSYLVAQTTRALRAQDNPNG